MWVSSSVRAPQGLRRAPGGASRYASGGRACGRCRAPRSSAQRLPPHVWFQRIAQWASSEHVLLVGRMAVFALPIKVQGHQIGFDERFIAALVVKDDRRDVLHERWREGADFRQGFGRAEHLRFSRRDGRLRGFGHGGDHLFLATTATRAEAKLPAFASSTASTDFTDNPVIWLSSCVLYASSSPCHCSFKNVARILNQFSFRIRA